MESKQGIQHPDPGERETARASLAAAEEARGSVATGVHYPPSYLWLMGYSGAAIPLLGAVGSGALPDGTVGTVLTVLGFLGVLAAAWALRVFESANGARITGMRFGRRLGLAYIAGMMTLVIAVSIVANLTGAWWIGLVAAPVGALVTVGYLRAWLAAYRRYAA